MKSLAAISIIEGRRGENLEDFQLLELLFRVSSQVTMYDTNVDINFQRERERVKIAFCRCWRERKNMGEYRSSSVTFMGAVYSQTSSPFERR